MIRPSKLYRLFIQSFARSFTLEDRGFLDGATVSELKRQRRVDVIVPLKANMLATQEAIQLAEMADQWEPHPSRTNQRIALVRGVEHTWSECEVPLNACVIGGRQRSV